MKKQAYILGNNNNILNMMQSINFSAMLNDIQQNKIFQIHKLKE
jgi:hypothetical protein